MLARDCRGTLAIGDKRLIALIGLEDTVVIDTDGRASWRARCAAGRATS